MKGHQHISTFWFSSFNVIIFYLFIYFILRYCFTNLIFWFNSSPEKYIKTKTNSPVQFNILFKRDPFTDTIINNAYNDSV